MSRGHFPQWWGYCNFWLVISVILHALNYQCTEIIHLLILQLKKWDNIVLKIETRHAAAPHQRFKMVTSILNENPGLSLERIGHQIIILLIIVQARIPTITRIVPHQSSKMITFIFNENPGLSLKRIGYQIIMLLINV